GNGFFFEFFRVLLVTAFLYHDDTPIIDGYCLLLKCPVHSTRTAYGEEAVEKLQQVAQICPVPRLGQPEDIAAATLFLASAEASFINGSQLIVDGGLSRLHVMSMPV
ncbi:MAG: NAD(P)-dependent dehydrogenase (short-subunit alcohol dehydrogenase family), partial [Zhongshania sp.]